MQAQMMADALDSGARREGRVHQHHGGTQLRQPVPDQVRAMGSTQRGSSLVGRLTSVLTGWAVMSSAG